MHRGKRVYRKLIYSYAECSGCRNSVYFLQAKIGNESSIQLSAVYKDLRREGLEIMRESQPGSNHES